MTEQAYYFTGVAVCALVIMTTILVLHRRFQIMMVDLCEGEHRARFWVAAVEAWFFLYSITSSLSWKPAGTADKDLFFAAICQIKSGLESMSNAIILFSVGLLFFVFIRKIKGPEKAGTGEAAV